MNLHDRIAGKKSDDPMDIVVKRVVKMVEQVVYQVQREDGVVVTTHTDLDFARKAAYQRCAEEGRDGFRVELWEPTS